jgi:hypothetical protein
VSGGQIGAFAAQELEAVSAEALGIRFGRQVLDQAGEPAEPMHAEYPGPGHVDVAREGGQHRHGPDGLDALRRVLERASPLQHGRLGVSEQARGGTDLVGWNPGDRLSPFRRVRFDALRQRLEAMGPRLNERLVVAAFADDHVEHGQRQRVVRAGAHAQPHLRALGELGLARIDDDDIGIVRKRLAHGEPGLSVRAGIERVVPPEQDAPRRDITGVVAYRQVAEGEDAGVDPGVEALCEPRLAPVRRAERMAEARHPADVMAPGSGAERNRLGTVALANGQEPRADLVERLVPGDAAPLPGAALAETAHGVFQAVGVIDEIERRRADGTEAAVVERRLAVPCHLHEHAVLDVEKHAAAAMAGPADALEGDPLPLGAVGHVPWLDRHQALLSRRPAPSQPHDSTKDVLSGLCRVGNR